MSRKAAGAIKKRYDIREASVAELADAPGLGPGVLLDVGVRVPSLAIDLLLRVTTEVYYNA